MRFQDLFHSPPGFFSPFLHSTCSLSVDYEYLALEDGPPIFRQDFTCPALLFERLVPPVCFRIRDYHPLWSAFPDRSSNTPTITFRLFRFRSPLLSESRLIFFSCSYLDVSVHCVRLLVPMYSVRNNPCGWVSPIRKSADQSSFASSPQLIASYYVPSSPVIAKASTTCTYSLDPITLQPHRANR